MNKELYNLPYPKNLVACIYGEELESYPDDFEASVQYCLYRLNERQRIALEYRYRDMMTLAEVGDNLGVGRESSRKIIEKAERHMRHPGKFRFIKYGIEQEIEQRLALVSRNYESKVNKLTDDVQAKMELCADELNLTIREFNCIRRGISSKVGNFPTIGELIDYINLHGSLRDIRNCGYVTQKEIIRKICNFGLRSELKINVDDILGR